MGEHGINPRDTEHTGPHNHDDCRHKALADSAVGGDGAIHESADRIGEAHDFRAQQSCFDNRFLIGEQEQEFSAEQEKRAAEDCACYKGIRDADEVTFQHAVPLSGSEILPHESRAGCIECRHDIINDSIGVGGGGIPLDHNRIKGVDRALNKEVGNGKNGILKSCGDSKPENPFSLGPVKPEFQVAETKRAVVRLPSHMDQNQHCGHVLRDDAGKCNSVLRHAADDDEKQVEHMGEARFVRDFCKWSQKQGYRVDHERQARKIFAFVQNGIPVLPHTPTTKIVVLEALRRVNELENSRDIILAHMNELGKTLPEYSLISEMKCIGEGLTPRIIAEIGDVRRFHNKHSLIAYAGIDAPPFRSGSYTAMERLITKRGNKYLRKVI